MARNAHCLNKFIIFAHKKQHKRVHKFRKYVNKGVLLVKKRKKNDFLLHFSRKIIKFASDLKRF